MDKIIKLAAQNCELNVFLKSNPNSDAVIVALHGGPGSGAKPLMNLPAFKELEEKFSMVYYDQRGSGDSAYQLSHGLTIQQITSDAKLVVDYARKEFSGKHIYLWGGSFGGLVSLLFLEKYPTAVEKAIISSPATCLTGKEAALGRLEIFKSNFAKMLPAELIEEAESLYFDENGFDKIMMLPAITNWFKEHPTPIEGYEATWHWCAMRAWVDNCDVRSQIKELKIPTLFLVGMEDPVIPAFLLVDAVEEYKNPLVSIKTYSPCGHAVFEDCKEEFCKECIGFFS